MNPRCSILPLKLIVQLMQFDWILWGKVVLHTVKVQWKLSHTFDAPPYSQQTQ